MAQPKRHIRLIVNTSSLVCELHSVSRAAAASNLAVSAASRRLALLESNLETS
jgi:DNA-binding transcriptional LysR family regulator